MHRATERRWANVFLFFLAVAVFCDILGFILPAWVRIYFEIGSRRVAQDYALWYMTQCESETWTCSTRSYYQLYDWTKNEIKFDGVPLEIPFHKLHDAQVLYTFGMIGTVASMWPLWKRRKLLVSKRNKEEPTRTTYIVAIALAFFSGMFVIIAAGMIGASGDSLRSVQGINVHRPTGLGLAAAGGTFAMVTALAIFLRLTLKEKCPDCTPVSRNLDVSTRETGNQVEVMVCAETTE